MAVKFNIKMGLRLDEAFSDGLQAIFLWTSDDAFVSAAIAKMSTDSEPAFDRHIPHPRGHLLRFAEGWYDPDPNPWFEDWCSECELPVPSEFKMLQSMRRPTSATLRDIKIDCVPDVITTEEVVDVIRELIDGVVIGSVMEEELPREVHDGVIWGLEQPACHRNIQVELTKSDMDDLGSVLTRGLIVHGLALRVREVIRSRIQLEPINVTQRRRAHNKRVQATPSMLSQATQHPAGKPSATRATQTSRTEPPSQSKPQKRQQQRKPRTQPQGKSTAQPGAERASRTQPQPPTKPAKPVAKPTIRQPPPPAPKQCYRCQRWDGHTSDACTNPHRCRKCGGNHRSVACNNNSRHCAVCDGEHAASARSCPGRPPPPPRPSGPARHEGSKSGSQHRTRVRALVSALAKLLQVKPFLQPPATA